MQAFFFSIFLSLLVVAYPAAAGPISDFFGLADTAELAEINKKIEAVEKDNSLLKNQLRQSISQANKADLQINSQLQRQNKELEKIKQSRLQEEQKLEQVVLENKNVKNEIAILEMKLNQFQNAQQSTKDQNKELIQSTTLHIQILCLSVIGVAIFGLLCLLWLRRTVKGNSEKVNVLKVKMEELQTDILDKLNDEAKQIAQSIETINAYSEFKQSSELDHTLIKALADRITFAEMTLSKMDKSVRGYKQLIRSIKQMKDNLRANGYELVEMLGQPYNEGMKVIATFVEDEDLSKGEQIITSVIKPQINYKGVMIQAAQITVSQNI